MKHPILLAKRRAKLVSKIKGIPLKAALQELAEQNGFSDWAEYRNSLDTFWYPKGAGFLNHWFADHAEAKDYRDQSGGFLLTYKGQFFVADDNYIESLGFDPREPIWERLEFDLSSSGSLKSFFSYYGKITAK